MRRARSAPPVCWSVHRSAAGCSRSCRAAATSRPIASSSRRWAMAELVPVAPRIAVPRSATLGIATLGIDTMSPAAIDQVRRLEDAALQLPQVAIETGHVLHAGLYARTIQIPAGVLLTGALIRIATL